MASVTTSGTAEVTLPAEDQILITREFAAPKHLVYKACTTPELIKRWWSAKRGAVTVADVDLRVGGKWRYVMVTDDGFEVAFHGEYRVIIPDEQVVSTEVYEMPGVETDVAEANATLNTVTFSEADGCTTLRVLVQCPSKEVRDLIMDSGMEAGMQDAYDLLEGVAVSLI